LAQVGGIRSSDWAEKQLVDFFFFLKKKNNWSRPQVERGCQLVETQTHSKVQTLHVQIPPAATCTASTSLQSHLHEKTLKKEFFSIKPGSEQPCSARDKSFLSPARCWSTPIVAQIEVAGPLRRFTYSPIYISNTGCTYFFSTTLATYPPC
jgi:hypothetical protein